MNDPTSTNTGLQADEFEERLRRSLRRVEAPNNFAVRALERAVASEKPLRLRSRFRREAHRGWIGAVAAILVLVVLVANQVRLRREQARIAQVQAQFDTAIRLTNHELEQTRVELERVGLKLGE
jgi:hypothetical protein